MKTFQFVAQDENEIRRIVESVTGLGLCDAPAQKKREIDKQKRFSDFEKIAVVGEGAFGQVFFLSL